MLLPPYQPPKLTPRVDFDESKFRVFLWTHGLPVYWEQSAECPCRRKSSAVASGLSLTLDVAATTGDTRADCVVCSGRGYYWHSGQTIVAQVTGLAQDPEAHKAWGESASGMAKITTLGENLLAFRDRITVLNSVLVYRETLQRGALVDGLRFPVVSRTLVLSTGTKTVSVLHARKADATGETTAPDTLVEGVDFEITGGQVDWTLGDALGTAPAVGDRYSMSYFARPRYVVMSFPYSIRDSNTEEKQPNGPIPTQLPVHALGKLEFLGGIGNGV